MKSVRYLFLFILFFTGINISTYAQTGSASNLPSRVQANFNAKYPHYTGHTEWKETREGYQATLHKDNKKIISSFNKEGRWINSRTESK